MCSNRSDHIHPHATPGSLRHLIVGRESCLKDQTHGCLIIQGIDCGLIHQTVFNRPFAQRYRIHAAPVIRQHHNNVFTALLCPKRELCLSLLSCFQTFLRQFHPMVHRIAHHVHQWVDQKLHHALVDARAPAVDRNTQFLALVPGQLARDARVAVKERFDRNNTQVHRCITQTTQYTRQLVSQPVEPFLLLIKRRSKLSETFRHCLGAFRHAAEQVFTGRLFKEVFQARSNREQLAQPVQQVIDGT